MNSIRLILLVTMAALFSTTTVFAAGGVVKSPTGIAPDQAWGVNGPNKPPAPPAPGTVPDPISEFIKAGRWQPAEEAQAPMVDKFKKENDLK